MKRSRFSATALAVAGVLALGASSALAAGPLINITEHFDDVPNTFVDVHPCTGDAIQVSSIESGVTHFVLRPNGTISATGTVRATFSGDLLPVDGIPDATGHYTVVFANNGAIREDGSLFGHGVTTFVLAGIVVNSDGSLNSFHLVAQTVFDADGNPKISFENASCQ